MNRMSLVAGSSCSGLFEVGIHYLPFIYPLCLPFHFPSFPLSLPPSPSPVLSFSSSCFLTLRHLVCLISFSLPLSLSLSLTLCASTQLDCLSVKRQQGASVWCTYNFTAMAISICKRHRLCHGICCFHSAFNSLTIVAANLVSIGNVCLCPLRGGVCVTGHNRAELAYGQMRCVSS